MLPDGLGAVAVAAASGASAALLLEEVGASAPDERAIAFAVFQLLGEHGGGPLLVAVDDVQWLDAASASVLAFALRRLAAAPAAILVARRSSGDGGGPARARPCAPERAAAAVAAGPAEPRRDASVCCASGSASRFRDRRSFELHETAGGNPFYALELARALEQSGGRAGAGERLTVPTSLTGLVSARLAALSEEVREVLEPVALLGEPTVSIVEAVASDTGDGAWDGFAPQRLRRSSSSTTSVFVSATPCWPRASRPSSSLSGGDRSIAGSPSWSAIPSSAPGTLRSARAGRRPESPTSWRAASAIAASRGSFGGGRRAGRALGLAHAGRCRRRRFCAAASCSRPTITTRAATPSDRVRSSSRCSSSCQPVPNARQVLRRLGESSDDDFERSERLLEQAFVEAESDSRLRAEIVMPASADDVSSPWAGGGGEAGADVGSASWRRAATSSCSPCSWRSSASRSSALRA